ncbi:hypothetical protein G5714_021943 [Onychostoma macrolepis]|uniref:Ig-like domain-containing protein n=1 Tax=Onychostoma macrolepis TaxID=369639 RepID=A0A7J6BUF0_9TELE|nr:hypothetical protein G5714_021943 [Onychostoma macrolepis]
MFVRCWFILFIHLIDKVSLQDPAEIIGGVGGSVILPCSYKERVLNTEEINVFWRYNNSVVVIDIEKGIPLTKEQDAMFKDRIDSFPSDYKKGNFSIRLEHLSFTSIGEFSCFIQNVDKEYKLRLQVRDDEDHTASHLSVDVVSSRRECNKHSNTNHQILQCFILRTYSSTNEGAKYENSIFKLKYSVKTNSHLFIRNISTDELGVYYCVKTSEPLKFSNGTKIYISYLVHRNQTESNDAPQHETRWRNLIITSVLFNVLLIIAVIGLVKCCLDATRRSKNTSEKPQSTTAAQNTNDLQYAEVDFSKRSRKNRPCPRPDQDQTTYSLLQPVKTV